MSTASRVARRLDLRRANSPMMDGLMLVKDTMMIRCIMHVLVNPRVIASYSLVEEMEPTPNNKSSQT